MPMFMCVKNQQEDLTAEDKKDFKELVNESRRDSQ
jgi:hypothetical protein